MSQPTNFDSPLMVDGKEVVPEEKAQVLANDGAVTIKHGKAFITKGSAGAFTLAAPTATTDDGKRLNIYSTTAFAHTVTQTTPGFNGGGGASDLATFGAAKGNNLKLVAYQGAWYVDGSVGITLS